MEIESLICPQCKSRMQWVEFDAERFLLAGEDEEIVIARCPTCGHEVSLVPVNPGKAAHD